MFIGVTSEFAFAEIEIDKSVYSKGEFIKISGTVNSQDVEKINLINIQITNLNNNDEIKNEVTPLGNNNDFSVSYDSSTWIIGEYKVTIRYNNFEDTETFEILGSASFNNDNSNNTNIINDNGTQQLESSSTNLSDTIPIPPANLKANVVSSTQIDLSWDAPDNNDVISGYKIEVRMNTDPYYSVAVEDTNNTDITYSDTNLNPDTVYAYRVFAINSIGESESSRSIAVKTPSITDVSNNNTADTDTPTDVTAKVISSTSVELSWTPPTQTFDQTIRSYTIKQELASNIYHEIASVDSSSTEYTVSNLTMDKTYVFVILANYALGSSDISEEATVTLGSSSDSDNDSSTMTPDDVPGKPTDLTSLVVSSTQIDLSWNAPDDSNNDSNNDAIAGYRIEARTVDSSSYDVIVSDTKNTSTKYSHTNLDADTDYIYRVSAINSEGTSDSSSEIRAKTLSSSDSGIDISQQNTFQDALLIDDVKKNSIEVFSSIIDLNNDPQHYVDRYNNEPVYKNWFDENFPEITIYESLGIEEPNPESEPNLIASFVDKSKDPQHYVDRYNNEPVYKNWFDENFPEYSSIYQAVGLNEFSVDNSKYDESESEKCGSGTELIDEICVIVETPMEKPWWQFW